MIQRLGKGFSKRLGLTGTVTSGQPERQSFVLPHQEGQSVGPPCMPGAWAGCSPAASLSVPAWPGPVAFPAVLLGCDCVPRASAGWHGAGGAGAGAGAGCRLLPATARVITRSPLAADLQEQINQSARLDEICCYCAHF